MTASDAFSEYYAELLQGTYDCVDRIVLNAFFPVGQTAGGIRTWWRFLHGDDLSLDDEHLREMAGTFSRRLQAFCAKHGIPLIEAQARDRKHELAQPHLPNDPNFSGLFLVIKGNAPAPIWEVKRNGDGQITEIRHRKSWPYVRHFYFHLIDREWGHVTIRICSYPPFGAQVILNGHERVERQARRKRVTVVKDGNCFIEGSNFSAISRLGAQFHHSDTTARLHQLCERWIYSTCLCFALPDEDRKRSHFQYQYSVFQLELSRNLLFWRGTTMNEVYQRLIDRTREPLALSNVKTIFGFSYRPHQIIKRGRERTEVSKAVQTAFRDASVLQTRWFCPCREDDCELSDSGSGVETGRRGLSPIDVCSAPRSGHSFILVATGVIPTGVIAPMQVVLALWRTSRNGPCWASASIMVARFRCDSISRDRSTRRSAAGHRARAVTSRKRRRNRPRAWGYRFECKSDHLLHAANGEIAVSPNYARHYRL